MAMHMANLPTLHPETRTIIATEANRPLYQPTRCDAEGNIYFRAYQADDRRVPVIRVDRKGSTSTYSLEGDPVASQGTSYDFSILPNGNLYRSVQVKEDVYIVVFNHDGRITQKIRLEKQFWVAHVTALSDRSFLVTGIEPQTQAERQARQAPVPVMALFDDSGRMVRNVSLVNESQAPTQKSDAEQKPPLLAVLEGDAQMGDNGDIYMVMRSEPVVIYVLDPSAHVKRSFQVDPPAPEMSFAGMVLSKNQLAIAFREHFRGMEHHPMAVVRVNNANGAVIARYSVEAPTGTTLACYTTNQFWFIGSDKNNLAIFGTAAK